METRTILILAVIVLALLAISYRAGYNSGFKKGFESTETVVKAAMILRNMQLEEEVKGLEEKSEKYKMWLESEKQELNQ